MDGRPCCCTGKFSKWSDCSCAAKVVTATMLKVSSGLILGCKYWNRQNNYQVVIYGCRVTLAKLQAVFWCYIVMNMCTLQWSNPLSTIHVLHFPECLCQCFALSVGYLWALSCHSLLRSSEPSDPPKYGQLMVHTVECLHSNCVSHLILKVQVSSCSH